MPISKKALTLAKLEAFQGLSAQGLLNAERLAQAIADGIAKSEIVQLTVKAFEGKPVELLEFAKKFNLITEKAVPAFGGVHRKGYFEYLKEQHPSTIPLIDAMNKLSEVSYEIKLDTGEVKTVQPMPFCRDITPKPEVAKAPESPDKTAMV